MKMKRVLAKDTRTALAMIKESLGDDAVILSNTKIAGEVEIVAAIDYDQKRVSAQSGTAFSDRLSANLDRIKSQKNQYKSSDSLGNVGSELYRSDGFNGAAQAAVRNQAPVQAPVQAPINDNMVRMEKELGLLRLLVEQQMSQSPSQNNSFISAAAIKVAQRLERMGFEKHLVDPLLAQLPSCDDADQLWDHAQQWLQDNLITSTEGMVHETGIYALVGPTGVGKTTAIGKLGAQLAMKHGKHKVALISMDQQRIGARDQLRIFGTMLGIEVHHVAGFSELTATLNQMAHKDYMLVDTSGGNPFDPHIQNLVDGLISVPYEINVYLTLAANSQSHSLRYLMKRYLGQVKGVVATKLDECLPLGGLLAALIESKQPLAMITDGQRIPLDLGYPSSQQLVAHAVESELAEEHGSIETLSTLLHATQGKPLGSRDRIQKQVTSTSTTSLKYGSLQDTPLAAMGLASYRSH
jgi:flagellar biosynthesis protein FlhF